MLSPVRKSHLPPAVHTLWLERCRAFRERISRCSMVNIKLEDLMSWKAPKIVEIALGAEINSYACAEAKK